MIVIGVDLGTTNSCVYYLDAAGNPVLVRDDKDHSIFPSAVWSSGPGREKVVAHKAKARMGYQPPPVIAVKRKMGTDEKVMLGGVAVDALSVSAEILAYLKALVEKTAGDKVGVVVVTVPAYFDAAPKRDTQLAAVKAFFGGDEAAAKGRLELQLEPEAAAYAYTATDPAVRLRVLVYDLGGGTFDVTVLEKTPEMGLSPLKFGGDPHLGGDNFDDRLALWILYLLRGGKQEALQRILDPQRYDPENRYTVLQQLLVNDVAGLRGVLRREDHDLQIPKPAKYDLNLKLSDPEDLGRIQKLKLLAENAKKDLTLHTEVAVVLQSAFSDHSGDLVDIDVALSRTEFDLLVGDLIAKTMLETAAVVARSGLRNEDFDRVLLVGGSSRMPAVAAGLKKLFSCPVALADPDLIVARGAAMRARFISVRGLAPAGGGPLTLDYPRRASERRVNITGQLSQVVEDGQVYLTRDDGRETNAAVDKDKFILRGVELDPGRENTFHLELLNGSEDIFAEADISIIHSTAPQRPDDTGSTAKITKQIRYLGRRGYRVLFPEGEPLPATKAEKCYRAGAANAVRIPIYEGERFLRDLRIEGIDASVNIGAEIEFKITIEKDYSVKASAIVVSSGHKADIQFQIDRIKMPSIEQMESDKEKVIEEIEDGLAAMKDPNKQAQFRRRLRRLDADFTKASKAAEPDSHHLFSLIGELKKLATDEKEKAFITPPLDEFEGLIRVCRGKAGQMEDTANVKKRDVLKKIESLEGAGKDAWKNEDQREWQSVVAEAADLLQTIIKEITPQSSAPPPVPPEAMCQYLLQWLDELAKQVAEERLDSRFSDEIGEYRAAVRAVDLREEDASRNALIAIAHKKIKPLEARMKKGNAPGPGSDDELPDWMK